MAVSKRAGSHEVDQDALSTLVDKRRPFDEAETDAQPVGVPLDASWLEEPTPDPFGEATTIARRRTAEIVSPDEATTVEAVTVRARAKSPLRSSRDGPSMARSGELSVPPRDVDPEQALGFMTAGLVVGLFMSAIVVFFVAAWLFAAG